MERLANLNFLFFFFSKFLSFFLFSFQAEFAKIRLCFANDSHLNSIPNAKNKKTYLWNGRLIYFFARGYLPLVDPNPLA